MGKFKVGDRVVSTGGGRSYSDATPPVAGVAGVVNHVDGDDDDFPLGVAWDGIGYYWTEDAWELATTADAPPAGVWLLSTCTSSEVYPDELSALRVLNKLNGDGVVRFVEFGEAF